MTMIVKILIIEDDEVMRSLIENFLEEEGFETDSVSNGNDAFQKLAKEPFDVIITDIRLPGLTGLDLLPEIKEIQPEASIIVMTAFGSEEIYHRSLERGATGYLEKADLFNKLMVLIHEMVASK